MKYPDIKLLRPYLGAFIILFVILNLFLAIVYRIPSTKIEAHVAQGLEVIEKEGIYLNLFPDVTERKLKSDAFRLDLFTDRVMLDRLIPTNKGLTPWLAALSMNNYTRFWHGYTLILRPLMVVFNYSQIRLINIFLLFILTLGTIVFLTRYLNIYAALALLFSLACSKLFIVPLCMAFCTMFYIFYLFLFALLFLAKLKREVLFNSQTFSLFIFILGMITSFIDLLLVPLLPVGLLISIACIWDYEKYNSIPDPLKVLRAFLLWGIGYIAMWLSKWILATILLGKNILLDAAHTIIFRIHGQTSSIKVDALSALKYNLLCTISPFNKFCILIIAGVIILLGILLVARRKLSINKNFLDSYRLYLLLLFIGCSPFIWVLTIANHSQIHFWFTYRIFGITTFSVFYILLKLVALPKVNYKLEYIPMGTNDDGRTLGCRDTELI